VSAQHAVVNPASEAVIAYVEQLDAEEVDEAIARSVKVLPGWKAVSPGDRARMLRRFSEVVDGANEELARLEVANSGHTISNARW
jgi:acyl-CoA reductase-like NAD-dependent aldehyde dehydrogenase